jgi:Cation transport ATPase
MKESFFILKLKSKRKAKKIEHTLKTQIGVNSVSIDFNSRLMDIDFDPDKISVEYMALVIRSIGSDMAISEDEFNSCKNQLGNYSVLKRRRKILYLLSIISMIGLIEQFSYWVLLGFSILVFGLYLSLFIYKSNKHFIRSFCKIDKIGIFLSSIFIITGSICLYYHKLNNTITLLFLLSIITLALSTIYRWLNEKKIAEMNLL